MHRAFIGSLDGLATRDWLGSMTFNFWRWRWL
jgi:hypothetical protein